MAFPTYKTESREDLEQRLQVVTEDLVEACLMAVADPPCGCQTCLFLRGVWAVMRERLPDAVGR